MLEILKEALFLLFDPSNLLLLILGVIAGSLAGCLPGITATMSIALIVPFTFTMPPATGLITIAGIYMGATYGGSISAILVNTPGTPANIATTFDGYPMTQKGNAQRALVAAATASAVGGIVGTFFLLFFSPPLADAALKFGPPEFFWLAIFGLTIIVSLSADNMLKGFIGGAFGLLLSTIGISPIGGEPRFTWGIHQLNIGIDIIVALIGFFCLPQVFLMVENRFKKFKVAEYTSNKDEVLKDIMDSLKKPFILLYSSIIGAFVGAVPGAGGNIAGMLSYNESKRFSKYPAKFGTGIIDGVVAAESANNAAVSGSLIPLLSLGIPGSPPSAVLLGALLLQGIRPGQELYSQHAAVTYSFILSLAVASVLLIPIGVFGARVMARFIASPINYLATTIVYLSVIGSFAIHNNLVEVYIMAIFGLLGYLMHKFGFEGGPIVLGLILGSFAEEGLVQSIIFAKASGSLFKVLFTRPISIVLIIFCLVSISWPIISKIRNQKNNNEGEVPS
ncbi:MAG: tripartite tricarboxylate transporter permease [Peptococcaceae bacterium]